MTDAPPTLTPAQERALLWLPEDGSPRNFADEHDENLVSLTVHSLLALIGLNKAGLADFAPEYGGTFSLTPAGQAARKAIEKEAANG